MEILQNILTALTTENEVLTNILIIPLYFVEVYISVLLFTTLLNIKFNNKQKICYIITLSILAIFTRNIIPAPLGSILNLVLGLFLIKYIFQISYIKAFLCELIPTSIMLIVESAFIRFFNFMFSIDLNSTALIPATRLFCILSIYLLLFSIYKFIKHFKIALVVLDDFYKKSKILLIIDIICGFVLLGIQLYLTVFYINNIPAFITFLSLLCLIAYFIISLYSIINISNLQTATNDLEREKLYNKSLAVLHDSVRGFKHDFGNIVQAIGGYIDANDMEGLRNYYKNLKADCIHVNNIGLLNPDTINNPALYSLIAGKYYKATEAGIHVDIDIFFDFANLENFVSIYELSRMLGILLDNAIEAAKECEYKHMILKIFKDDKRNCIKFRILNTYNNKDVNTDRIFQKGYSTKEGNSGLGLWEVHKYLSKHNNLDLFTSKDENYFSQQLEIFYNQQ